MRPLLQYLQKIYTSFSTGIPAFVSMIRVIHRNRPLITPVCFKAGNFKSSNVTYSQAFAFLISKQLFEIDRGWVIAPFSIINIAFGSISFKADYIPGLKIALRKKKGRRKKNQEKQALMFSHLWGFRLSIR